MRMALIVPRLSSDKTANMRSLLALGEQAATGGATLLLYPEAALTGLVNNDDPKHDLPMGQTIPGPVVSVFAKFCRLRGAWLGIGLLERDTRCLYDSAVLLDPAGNIALHYRRMQPQWHSRNADPAIYRQGDDLLCAETPFGRVAFLICGDLFDDTIIARLCTLKPDLLLYPFARCLPGGVIDKSRWDAVELPEYRARVSLARVKTLMVNYLTDETLVGDGSLGGAWVIDGEGTVLASLNVGMQGILYADV